jgi:hypothetical protein
MYPGYARTAREEGFEEIAEWFEVSIFNIWLLYSCLELNGKQDPDLGTARNKEIEFSRI